ncbi:hypothetical protein JH146_0154 [Methanocaldococcus bathoardescens]|uniref:Uncharacterized protein n=1 Tax=Methanocaldococcus bathoardescens TaxID=1301915 RepID=A0A076L9M3_9EURY|nr:hypothetical protein [Methanocaldococcus bathoardescens]AIJ05005.1 hypothetical protein JH146_0154 [Methanocaldococcus bathoardescens]
MLNVRNKIIPGFLMGFLVTASTILLVFLNLKEVANLLIFLILFGIFIYVAKKSHPLFGDREEQLMIFLVGLLWGVFWILGIYLSSKFLNFKLFGISIVLFSVVVEMIVKKSAKVEIDEELIDELKITISEKSAFRAVFSFLISSIVLLYLSISAGLNLEISVYDMSSLPLMILISQLIIFRAYYTLKFS